MWTYQRILKIIIFKFKMLLNWSVLIIEINFELGVPKYKELSIFNTNVPPDIPN